MNNPLFIGIDIGTQGTKAVLTDSYGNCLADAFCPSVLHRPDSITVYEDAENIFESVIKTIRETVDTSGVGKNQIKAIGIDAQMAGIMGVDNDFTAVTPFDSWLDSRCRNYTELINEKAAEEAISTSGGQILHTHASKLLWWKNEHPEAYAKIKKFVMPNGFVAGKLCGLSADDAFMDYTFLHFNVFSDNRKLCFNENLIKFFGVDEDKLPKIVDPVSVIGTVKPEYAEKCGISSDCKIIAGCGDTAASSLGAGVTKSGLAYDVAGTASVFACSTDTFAPDIKHKTVMFSRSVCKDLYLPLAYISGGGVCLEWYSNLVSKNLKELDSLIDTAKTVNTPIFIPHFSGRTCPLESDVSGAFLKMNANCDTGIMYRAILEAIAFEYKSYLDILKDSGCVSEDTTVIGVGGGAKSPVFSQIKADVLNTKYVIPKSTDSAPVAMAVLSSIATNYRNESLDAAFDVLSKENKAYTPRESLYNEYSVKAENYINLLNGYSEYIKNA